MPKISALPSLSTLADADVPPIVDDSTSTTKKFTLTALREYLDTYVKTTDSVPYDYVVSGCAWTGDSYGVNRNASMTAGVMYINGRRHTVALVTARTFTASKDTYVDALSNGDGTATLVYTEVANNAASPTLAANSIRLGIVVTGASTIASVASINQGQVGKTLPIASSNPYAVTDSLGNLILPKDPQRRLLAHRMLVAQVTINASGQTDVTGLNIIPFISPDSYRKIKVSGHIPITNTAGGLQKSHLLEGANKLNTWQNNMPTAGAINTMPERTVEFSAGLHTLKAAVGFSGTTNSVYSDGADWWAWVKVELL